MREAIASRCRIPVEMLHLEDRLAELESLMGSGTFLRYIFDPCWCRWEHGLFLGRLEKRLGSLKNNIRHFTIGEAERELPPWKSSEGETVGDWLSQAVTVIKLP
jgi:hypothetical protein